MTGLTSRGFAALSMTVLIGSSVKCPNGMESDGGGLFLKNVCAAGTGGDSAESLDTLEAESVIRTM